ncbi:hypothetical protein [Lactobacillus terrae]|uniref:hypothetical protein n=1 Tax=Lactobacillus terrae TaxID=2269374 RepID=UPI000C1B7744|nr:hypothetical protein [Lactobacillus terrae]
MYDNFGNAYTTHFVGAYDTKEKIYQIGEPGYVFWGALNANSYALVQIEFARSTSPETFKIAY